MKKNKYFEQPKKYVDMTYAVYELLTNNKDASIYTSFIDRISNFSDDYINMTNDTCNKLILNNKDDTYPITAFEADDESLNIYLVFQHTKRIMSVHTFEHEIIDLNTFGKEMDKFLAITGIHLQMYHAK